jgi:adenylosuccinate synthase
MIKGKFNVIIDSAWGSSGKGKVASWLAKEHGVTDASSCNMPNAGHTVQVGTERTVYKVLPAASHFGAHSWLGPGTIFDPERFDIEMRYFKIGPITVHPRAGVLKPEHAQVEREMLNSISSTMQGSGAALCDKIMRLPEAVYGHKW